MGTCNTMKNAANKAVILQMVLTPAVANSPLASECINLKDNSYNAYFTGSDASSAGMITNGNNFLFIFCYQAIFLLCDRNIGHASVDVGLCILKIRMIILLPDFVKFNNLLISMDVGLCILKIRMIILLPDFVKFNNLLISMVVAVLFFHW